MLFFWRTSRPREECWARMAWQGRRAETRYLPKITVEIKAEKCYPLKVKDIENGMVLEVNSNSTSDLESQKGRVDDHA